MNAEQTRGLCQRLTGLGVEFWVCGGWGIDALLARQTRSHKDLDILVRLDDVVPLRSSLEADGFSLKELWSENAWKVDRDGNTCATAFVLRNPDGLELDIHALRFDDAGRGIPAWASDEGFVFEVEDLGAHGTIAGYPVRCLSVDMQRRAHTGYALPENQKQDLRLLDEAFEFGGHNT